MTIIYVCIIVELKIIVYGDSELRRKITLSLYNTIVRI